MNLKIDVFNHVFPEALFRSPAGGHVNKGAIKRWLNIPFLHDTDVRFRMLEEFGDEYRQVLSLSAPPIESINPDRQITLDLARLANDSMADLVRMHPDRFPGFIASLPLNHPDESVAELERSVTDARRARRAGVLERQRSAARRRTVFPALRNRGPPAMPDLSASRPRRQVRRLPRRREVQIRDLVDVRLAVRDQRGHAAAGLFAAVRSPAGHQDRGAPSRRDGPVFRRASRVRARPVRQPHGG